MRRKEREYVSALKDVSDQLKSKNPHMSRMTGLCDGARTAFLAAFADDSGKLSGQTRLIIAPDEKEAMRVCGSMAELGLSAAVYPYRDFVFHNITASHECEHERLNVLFKILNGEIDVVVATAESALQYTMPKEVLSASVMHIDMDTRVNIDELTEFLVKSGYTRTEMVDGVGQFSIRGGIIDIYTASGDNPVRIELFDDEIDSMGPFDVITQRRTEQLDEITITPAREIIADGTASARLMSALEARLAKLKKHSEKEACERISADIDALRAGVELKTVDRYISCIYEQKECMLDYFGKGSVVFIEEYGAVIEKLRIREQRLRDDISAMLSNNIIIPEFSEFGKWQSDFEYFAENRAGIILELFASSSVNIKTSGMFSIITKQTVSYNDKFELLLDDLKTYKGAGFSAVMLCDNEIMAKNLRNMLEQNGIMSVVTKGESPASPEMPLIMYGFALNGYELTASKFVMMSMCVYNSGYSRASSARKVKKAKRSAQERIMSYADLEAGDYVVHEKHGIGIYLGMESVTVEGVTKDYMKIKYAGTDMLYLPCNQLEMLSKYIGARAEDGTLKLSRMGGGEWKKAKSQVKQAAKEMAKELIKLYAERQRKEGFAFLPDDDMQREFEDSFEYAETDGQLAAIKEVKKDMEATRPMDRLLCGDVGFGKTEVAIRAAFKAVESGKQVAILVPTTILALQHYQTFVTRMRGFPVRIDMLSRFRTPKQQAETLRKVKRGETDILIGTHRIVSKDVVFKDLKLVIIDEEQRFGVAHKEKLKQMSENADVLTLTATPIPRTLNMAMSGIRDMSILEEAPLDRVPVQTYVLEYDDATIAEAINRELNRGGQVFYLHNRIEDADEIVGRLSAMAPDARIVSANGRMEKDQLSDIWRDMLAGEIDILVSTTIIESGVDVPNANTLIIERADKLGLSQLHQIRGRVGRSSRRAYAYLTYPKGIALTEIAEKRLGAIRDYTEFGSGFKVALRDLEIRGAGNLLGAEQHGHIENVGYDMYMRLLNEAIIEEKGTAVEKKIECTVDMNCDAYIPESYIKSQVQRIDIYKKISLICNKDDMADVTDELLDRYGNMPDPVGNLLRISLLRALGSELGITKIQRRAGGILIYPTSVDMELLSRLAAENKGRILMTLDAVPYITYRLRKNDDAIYEASELLKRYGEIKKEIADRGKES